MKNMIKFLSFFIIAFTFTLTVSSEEVVRISFVVSEDLVEQADEDSTLVVLKSDYIDTNSLVLPYLELECTLGKSIIPLNTGQDGLSSIIVRNGELQLYFQLASWCDSKPRNPIGLTIVLFVIPADKIVKLNS